MNPIRERPRAAWPESAISTDYGSHRVWIENERRVRVWGTFALPVGTYEGSVVLADYGSGFEAARESNAVEFFDGRGITFKLSRSSRGALVGACAGAVNDLRAKRGDLFETAKSSAQSNRLRDIEDKLRSEFARCVVLIDAWRECLPTVEGPERVRSALGRLVLELLTLGEKHAPAAFPCLRVKDGPCVSGGPPCRHCRVTNRITSARAYVREALPSEET